MARRAALVLVALWAGPSQGLRAGGAPKQLAAWTLPLELRGQLVVADIRLGDGHTMSALLDTGSGNIMVPSAHCESAGCQGHKRFRPEEEEDGQFLGGDAASLHLSFSGAHLSGGGFEGEVCVAGACGRTGFVVAAWLSDAFASLKFDAILGLGPPRQAVAPRFNLLSQLVEQRVIPEASFTLSLRRGGAASAVLGSSTLSEASGPAAGGDASAANASAWMPADSKHGEWAVMLESVGAGDSEFLTCPSGKRCRAILDSGCPGLSLPDQAFQAVKQLLPPLESGCSSDVMSGLPRLRFRFGEDRLFEVRPEHYVEVPEDGSSNCRYNIQSAGDTSSRTVVLGVPFLLDRDVAFDQGRMRVRVVDAVVRGERGRRESSPATPDPAQLAAGEAALTSLDSFLHQHRAASA